MTDKPPRCAPSASLMVFLVGPTGVGKSRAAVRLASPLGAEIVSADSMLVYRGMDIATAKLTPEERLDVPHHLIDVVQPTDPFSVGMYRRLATAAIEDIHKRGKLPLVCGGTGLYVRSLLDGLFEGPEADWELRGRLQEEAERSGSETLHARLREVDPLAAARISPKDLRRIVRALEVHEKTQHPISDFQIQWRERQCTSHLFGLTMSREALYARVEERVEEMFERGLVEETRRLLEQGLRYNRTAMQAIGYKEVIGFLEGEYSLEEAKRLLKRNTRHYAKRQLTWFRKDDRILWYNVDDYETTEQLHKELFEAIRRVIRNPGSPSHPSL